MCLNTLGYSAGFPAFFKSTPRCMIDRKIDSALHMYETAHSAQSDTTLYYIHCTESQFIANFSVKLLQGANYTTEFEFTVSMIPNSKIL